MKAGLCRFRRLSRRCAATSRGAAHRRSLLGGIVVRCRDCDGSGARCLRSAAGRSFLALAGGLGRPARPRSAVSAGGASAGARLGHRDLSFGRGFLRAPPLGLGLLAALVSAIGGSSSIGRSTIGELSGSTAASAGSAPSARSPPRPRRRRRRFAGAASSSAACGFSGFRLLVGCRLRWAGFPFCSSFAFALRGGCVRGLRGGGGGAGGPGVRPPCASPRSRSSARFLLFLVRFVLERSSISSRSSSIGASAPAAERRRDAGPSSRRSCARLRSSRR